MINTCIVCDTSFEARTGKQEYCGDCQHGKNAKYHGKIVPLKQISGGTQKLIDKYVGFEDDRTKIVEHCGSQYKKGCNQVCFRCFCKVCKTEYYKIKDSIKYSVYCPCQHKNRGHRSTRFTGYKEITGKYWASIKNNAGARDHLFDIKIEYVYGLFIEQNKRCAMSGVLLGFGEHRTASLDRINSDLGYVKNNVQWVHKTVNKMKNTLSSKEFISWCVLIGNRTVEHEAK
jgi:hypothetical protein